LAASTAAPRSTPLIDRPEPLPVPSASSAMTIAGRPNFSFRRAGDDADDAGMPAATGDDQQAVAFALFCPLFGRLLDQHLDRPALLVQPVELGGDRARFLGVAAGQQPNTEVGLADPAARIDARAERKAEIAAGWRLHQPRRLGERDEPEVLAARHHFQPLGDKGAVKRLQPSDIGNRAERDQVEQIDDRRLLGAVREAAAIPQLAEDSNAEQEGHANGSEMAVGGAVGSLVEPVGIDDRKGAWQLGGALVMVTDDDVEAASVAACSAAKGLGAAIDGDDQIGAGLLQRDQGIAGGAIALHQTVGDVGTGLEAEATQEQDQQGGAVAPSTS
jgi:hypothetical protein